MLSLGNYALPEDAYRLKNLMHGVLEAVVSVYESNNMPLPTRRYTTMASPIIDCEQVVVSFVNAYLGRPGDQAAQPLPCDSIKSAVLSVSIAREHPVVNESGKPPSADQMQKASDIAAVDTWILLENLDQFEQWGIPGRGPGVIATINAIQNQGGYQEVRLQLTLAVP